MAAWYGPQYARICSITTTSLCGSCVARIARRNPRKEGAPELAQLQLDVVKEHVLKPAREQDAKFVNLLAKEVDGHVKKVRAR